MCLYQAKDSTILKIHLKELVDEFLEHCDNNPREESRGILESKWHESILKISPLSGERGFVVVLRCDSYLMVS